MTETETLTVRLRKSHTPRRHWTEVAKYEVIVNGTAVGIVTSHQTSTTALLWSGRAYGSPEISSGHETRKAAVAAVVRRVEGMIR